MAVRSSAVLLWGLGVLWIGQCQSRQHLQPHHDNATAQLKVPPNCPSEWVSHAPGTWSNPAGADLSPCGGHSTTCHEDTENGTLVLCARKCEATLRCIGFEVYQPAPAACYVFLDTLAAPFTPNPDCVACIKPGTPTPPPAPPPPTTLPPTPPNRGPTHGNHTFPRLGNCWGADPYITPKMWNYLHHCPRYARAAPACLQGFPNMTMADWGRYDVQYINPFDSCCWAKEMGAWTPLVKSIKQANPAAIVLATFHATEIWEADLVTANKWLPDKCIIRNTAGATCSWWGGLVFTNNLFDPDCLDAAVANALAVLPDLLAAGVDGVFLDGVVDFDIGCSATPCNGHCSPTADINCTSANCTHTPQQPYSTLHARWVALYAEWFRRLSEVHPGLVWVNNLALEQGPFVPISNGRQYEGGAGLDQVYGGVLSIGSFVTEIRMWNTKSVQPSYVNVHMNANMGGGLWRIGRWQNLVTQGEMMRLMTDFRRMRFGLGVALLTDGYYGYDVGSEMYGAPAFYTEYEAELGQAVGDPTPVSATGDVWVREFDLGYVVVSSVVDSNVTVTLPHPVWAIALSTEPARLSGGREAPAWQFIVDNSLGAPGNMEPAGASDWWATPAQRAAFRTVDGNWTTVSDQTQSHQYGDSFLVGFTEPGGAAGTSQGFPGAFSAAWIFVAPATGAFNFAVTAVDAHFYPLTDGAVFCIRESGTGVECIAQSVVDQRAEIRDGRWQSVLSGVPLREAVGYEVTVAWDPTRSGYVVADALLVESTRLYHGGGGLGTQVTVGALDSRVVLKAQP